MYSIYLITKRNPVFVESWKLREVYRRKPKSPLIFLYRDYTILIFLIVFDVCVYNDIQKCMLI